MKYKFFKRITRNYEEKFSKEKKTDEIHIDVNGVKIYITEHQCGYSLDKPYVTIFIPKEYSNYNGIGSYSMDFDTFIKKAIDLSKK